MSDTLEDYTLKAQAMNYEGIRAMFEAYSRNKYTSTGVIQWMLNNAWPSMIWHLYDYYLRPAGRILRRQSERSNRSIRSYGYDDHSVWVVSSQYEDAKGLKLITKVYNLDMTEKFSQESSLDAAADSTHKSADASRPRRCECGLLVVLRLEDGTGKLVGSNFYWLSSKPETLDWEKSNWYMTPDGVVCRLQRAQQLPKVKLRVASRSEQKGDQTLTRVTLENPSKSLAFFVRLKVNKGAGGEEILPVLWQDNYVSLLPGEKRELTASYRSSALGQAKPSLEVSGWNLQ